MTKILCEPYQINIDFPYLQGFELMHEINVRIQENTSHPFYPKNLPLVKCMSGCT